MDEKKKILIIEDTVDTVDLLKKRFKAEGYDTAEAYDGEEGLKVVEEYRPDLIVLDVMMPKLNGFEVCERLKTDERTKFIPILMLSAKSRLPHKIKGLDIGADDYLTKPFEYKELSARVKSLLAKKEASEKMIEEEKSEALDHMVDEVAHEVRNPLVVIGGLARRVSKSLPEGSRNREYLEIIMQNVAALEKMIKHLVDLKSASLSYIESSDINEIISASLSAHAEELEKNSIEVKIQPMSPPLFVSVDKENLIRAFSCLIENAIEAMRGERKVLEISTLVSNGSVEIEFTDTGKGISRETIKNIYDPFFTSKTYGPGLGLTFVLKTVQSHKGMISVKSEEGEGTTFNIKLPIRHSSS